jgi:acyl carrier protein
MVTGHTYKHVSFAEFVPHYPANSRTSLLGLAILCLVFCAFCLAALAQPGKVSAAAAGAQHSLFLETNGTWGGSGRNSVGELGEGSTRARTSPVKVGDGVAVCSAGDYHSLFVTRDGRLFAMGDIRYGQLGTGRTRQVTAPVEVMQKVGSGAAGGLLRSAALGFTRHPSRILPCDRFFSLGFFRCCHAGSASGNHFQHQQHNHSHQMSDKSIEERVKDIIVDQLGVSADQVTADAKFVEDLGADSLDTVELVMALEEEFDVEVPDDEAEKLQAVNDVVSFITSKKG